jgi:protein-disulfide isomerase
MPRRRFELSHPVDATDHVLGAEDAAITVVEYGDFECPYCGQAAPGIQLMLKRYAGRVRFAYRHFLPEDLHPHALIAAEAAECAASQGAFWPMHHLLYRRQDRLSRPDLNAHARELRLDGALFKASMDARTHELRIREQARTGVQSGVRATPGIFVNAVLIDVAFDLQTLYDAIESAER